MRYDMPVIETKRLLLRPLEEGDACDMYAYCSLPEVTKYLSFSPHKDVDHTLHILHKVLLPYGENQDMQTWVIVSQAEDKVIGHLGLHSLDEHKAQVGYVLHPAYWNQGIMKEALRELVHVGFTHCGLSRIEALYETSNLASGMLLHACGFKVEGTLRSYTKLSDDKYHDMILTAILKDDR